MLLRLLLGFACVAFVSADVQTQRPRAAFRAGVELVSLHVTVTGPGQRYVGDLNRDDFVVVENGIPQKLTFFARTGVPLALALLVDTSASMEQALVTAQEAAIGFVRQLASEDVATVVDFDSRVQIAQGFTSDRDALERAIRQTTAGGSTSMYNAIYIAIKELSRLTPNDDPDAPRRRVIVVLSDGEDTSSLVSFEEVLDVASRSDTLIYAIGLGVGQQPGPRSSQSGEFILRRLAQQTGGRAFFTQDVKDLASVYADIRNELASQYSLAYESAAGTRDGQWRRVQVQVKRPNAVVRTRAGYFAAAR